MNKITLQDYMKARENKKKFRLKVQYKADTEEEQYKPDIERMMKENLSH